MEVKSFNKKNLIIILCSVAVFIGLMVLATFKDLQINIALRNPDSVFAQVGEYLGQFPGYLAAGVAFIILFQSITKDNKFYIGLKILFGIHAYVGVLVFIRYLMSMFFKEEIMYQYLYMNLFAIIVTALAILATNHIDKQLMKKLALFSFMVLLALLITQVLTLFMKSMWSRLRFRHLNANYEGFSPWYKLNFSKIGREHLVMPDNYPPYHTSADAFRSFPSGHTVSAGLSFSLILLPDIFERLQKHKTWFYVCPIVYTLLVAFSRIIARAHYLSDVLVGFAISIATVLLARWVSLLLQKKYIFKRQGD